MPVTIQHQRTTTSNGQRSRCVHCRCSVNRQYVDCTFGHHQFIVLAIIHEIYARLSVTNTDKSIGQSQCPSTRGVCHRSRLNRREATGSRNVRKIITRNFDPTNSKSVVRSLCAERQPHKGNKQNK